MSSDVPRKLPYRLDLLDRTPARQRQPGRELIVASSKYLGMCQKSSHVLYVDPTRATRLAICVTIINRQKLVSSSAIGHFQRPILGRSSCKFRARVP